MSRLCKIDVGCRTKEQQELVFSLSEWEVEELRELVLQAVEHLWKKDGEPNSYTSKTTITLGRRRFRIELQLTVSPPVSRAHFLEFEEVTETTEQWS